MANIRIEGLRVKFQQKSGEIVTALNNVSMTFKHGEFSVILGNSGGGKTTLLHSIIGSVLINGHIYINDIDTEKLDVASKNISYVSQEFSLYPHMTIYENIAFPLSCIGVDENETKMRVIEISKKLGVEELLNRLPKELSIGQKQRVALARSLIKRSDIYLFDEPFSNIDIKKSEELKKLLKQTLKELDATVLFVTHSVEDAFLLADTIYIIEDGELLFSGTMKELQANNSDLLKPYYNIEDRSEWKI